MTVPLETWQVGPWNRWAYQHVAELVPTVAVRRDPERTWELPEAREGTLDDVAAALCDSAYADGVAVVSRGGWALERYANGMEPDTLHLSQSVGKSVLGLLVGVLAERGALDPSALVTEYVPEVGASGYAGATVQHVLDMTAAIDFVEDYAVDFWRYDIVCGWHPPHPEVEAESILEFLPSIGPAAWRHGERFHYSSPNTDLLGIAAERAGGAPLAELISTHVWGPLGAEHDAGLAVDPAGTGVISGGFCATLRDYARMGALVAAGGRGVVPETWVGRLGHADPEAFARTTYPQSGAGADGYGSQWWHRDGGPLARGIHGQLISVDRRTGVAVTVLSSWPAATDPALEATHRRAVTDLRARLA
jgi:CubicO group peptidase (beta-lactamase class C family)